MEPHYDDAMKRASEAELRDIVRTGEVGYAAEAIRAARAELTRRGLGDEAAEDLTAAVVTPKEGKLAGGRVSWQWRLGFFILSFGAFPNFVINGVVLTRMFKVRMFGLDLFVEGLCLLIPLGVAANQARRKKAGEAFFWMLVGLVAVEIVRRVWFDSWLAGATG